MFWRMGFLNARRNLARSVLVIISMAIATGFMVFSFDFNRGYAYDLYKEVGSILGGEIALYATSFDGSSSSSANLWEYHPYTNLYNTDIDVFFPELQRDGYLTPSSQICYFSADILTAFDDLPFVNAIYPRYQIPAQSKRLHQVYETSLRNTPVRGRDRLLDEHMRLHPRELLVAGRWFDEKDENELVAVVSVNQHFPSFYDVPQVGDTVEILLPRAFTDDQKNVYDFTVTQTIKLQIIGVIDVPTRLLTWEGWAGDEWARVEWPMSWLFDEIQVPLGTWRQLWNLASTEDYYPEQVNLSVSEVSRLEDIAAEVRLAYPAGTVVSVPQLMQKANHELLLEDPALFAQYAKAMGNVPRIYESGDQQGMALDLRIPLTIILLLIAGVATASHFMLLIDARRQEFGILKSVGALRINIVQLVLAEALALSCCGSLAGYFFFRLPTIANQLTNGLSIIAILRMLWGNLAFISGIAFSITILFAALPAWLSTRVPATRLLQD